MFLYQVNKLSSHGISIVYYEFDEVKMNYKLDNEKINEYLN